MLPSELQAYLYNHIPISKAMGVKVCECSLDKVVLSAPLAPNINHRDTVFGGSASALAIFSAWSLLHLRLVDYGTNKRLVIQSNTMSYDKPIVTDFNAVCIYRDEQTWEKFTTMLKRKKRARITVTSTLECQGETVGGFEGQFVAFVMK